MPDERSSTPCPDCTALYEAELRRHPTRSRNNLARLKQTLDHMVATKMHDFTTASVVRVHKELRQTSPSESSIRNPEGRHFKALIDTYARHHGPQLPAPTAAEDERVELAIEDQALASLVKRRLREHRALTREVHNLKAHIASLKAIPPEALLAYAKGELLPAPGPAQPALHEGKRRAIRGFLANAAELLPVAWDEASGALLDTRGNEVAGPHFLHALRDLLGDAVGTGGDGEASTGAPLTPAPSRLGDGRRPIM